MERTQYLEKIRRQFQIHPACALIGPRQVGKTTIARQYAEISGKESVFFDLENPQDLTLFENPLLILSRYTSHLIIIGEVQRRPDLFPILRVLIDEKKDRQFLILGSASPDLLRQSSETLAGRIGYVELPPFSLREIHDSNLLWLRGGFPLSCLAQTDKNSFDWRKSYIATFLERDLGNLGFSIPPQQMRRLWSMLALYHGQTFNANALGRSLALSDHTVRKYLDILSGTFMMRILTPWYENIMRQQVKSPKVYFRDSGILFALLGIASFDQLQANPDLGAFWEGFAIEEVIRVVQAATDECYFWATHRDAELDLLIMKGGKRLGFECKYTRYPKVTKSMEISLDLLKLDHLAVLYPGTLKFPLAEKITAYGLENLTQTTFEDGLIRQIPG